MFRSHFLGFLNVTNSILLELVTTITSVWSSGVVGVSDGVMSVIADYCHPSPPLLTGYTSQIKEIICAVSVLHLYCIIDSILDFTELYCTLLNCTVLYFTELHCTVLYLTVLY